MRRRYSSNKTASGGLGICDVLTLIFIVLKLTHIIDWSWVWVLCPLWIGFVGIVLFVIGKSIYLQIKGDRYV